MTGAYNPPAEVKFGVPFSIKHWLAVPDVGSFITNPIRAESGSKVSVPLEVPEVQVNVNVEEFVTVMVFGPNGIIAVLDDTVTNIIAPVIKPWAEQVTIYILQH